MMKRHFFPLLCLFLALAACKPSPECKITSVPQEFGWPDFYSKYVNVSGIHLMSSWRVPDSCLVQAYKTLYAMTSMLPPAVLDSMVSHNTRVAVMARYEGTTDIPEHAYLKADTSINWDLRARGLEGTMDMPLTTCAEENILAYQIDPYHAEDILVHEFAHTIHLVGIKLVDPSIDERLQRLLDDALAKGKYNGTYARENFIEYWAEGVQDWFNVNAESPVPNGKHNWVNTREDLLSYDPGLYSLIAEYFPDTDEHISKHPKVNLYKGEPDAAALAASVPKAEPLPEGFKIEMPPAGYPDFYKKYVDCNGIPVISSWRVPDSCLVQAYRTLYAMTSMLSPEILQAMRSVDARVAIMGRYEGTTDVPEHAALAADTALNWNLRARGLGGDLELTLTSGAEENILAYQIDKYHAEDILIHEFSHAIHLIGILQVHPDINLRLTALLDKARAESRFENTYASTDIYEYWAEGVQDWFNVNAEMPRPDGKHNWVNTREELRAYDPGLYSLISEYFPETDEPISRHRRENLYTGDTPF